MIDHDKYNLAYWLAKNAHKGQKYGDHDYFEYHVIGVASQFEKGSIESIIALLHDTIEDTDVEFGVINSLFDWSIALPLMKLSRNLSFATSYHEYIDILSVNSAAKEVKKADLRFHLSQKEIRNENRYRKALAYLEALK